ncbi:serpin 2 precursor, putative, partial [Ixodes scapularis]
HSLTSSGERAVGSLRFPVEVFKRLVYDHADSDVFFSPCGLAASLSMLLGGAHDQAAAQVVQLLHLHSSDSPTLFHELLICLRNAAPNIRLKMANVSYVDKQYQVVPEYLSFINKFYEASLREAPFSTHPQAATAEINERIEHLTNAVNVLNGAWVNSNTQLVVVQALHFRALWDFQFVREDNVRRDFTDVHGDKHMVDMMVTNGVFRSCVYTELDTAAVELPYKDVGSCLVLLKPNSPTGINALVSGLTPIHLDRLLKALRHKGSVSLTIPRLRLRKTCEMSQVLKELGLTSLFSDATALLGIAANRPLSCSLLVQRVSLTLDERGSEAPRPSADLDVLVSSASGAIEFTLDRPFVFVLLHRDPFAVVFMGCVKEAPVTNPTKTD